jgi:hypothetical protein
MGVHEPSAQERMPPVIAQKRRVNDLANFFVTWTHTIAESNNCSLKEAAELMIGAVHKRYLEVMEEEKHGN